MNVPHCNDFATLLIVAVTAHAFRDFASHLACASVVSPMLILTRVEGGHISRNRTWTWR